MDTSIIQGYMDKMMQIQEMLLSYLENEESEEIEFHLLKQNFKELQIHKDKQIFIGTFNLISKISENHHRQQGFISKIERILKYFRSKIKKFMTKSDIFNIFKDNKRILLFLFEEKIIIPNKRITEIITSEKYKEKFYPEYFLTEFKSFYDESLLKKINSRIPEEFRNNEELFEQKRKIGENSNDFCQMIQNDLIDEFIIYATKTNLNLTKTLIVPSIFETNSFLFKEEISLIEYAAFFGSIQIFQYLLLNDAELKPSLWIYVIHGHNPQMIHILEENEVEAPNYSYIKCFIESIKCHHIDFMEYIKSNLYTNDNEKNIKILLKSLRFYNFYYFVDIIKHRIEHSNKFYNSEFDMDVNDEFAFFYDLCKYNYLYLVDFFIENRKININMIKVSYIIYFLSSFKLGCIDKVLN